MSDQTTVPTSAPIPMDRAGLLARIERVVSHCEVTTLSQTDPKAVGVGARGFAAVAELYGRVAGLIGPTKIEHTGSVGLRVGSNIPTADQLDQATSELEEWRQQQLRRRLEMGTPSSMIEIGPSSAP